MKNLDWFYKLNKPEINPPGWIFAPVWTMLYLFIFLSLVVFIFQSNIAQRVLPLTIFVVQILLNLIWSPIFFGAKKIGLALIVNILLLISIIALIVTFFSVSKIAAILLIPYFLWVCFALYLNFMIWRLN